MSDSQRYDDLVQSIERYGYVVTKAEHGYIMASQSDSADISYARHVDDLADFLDLIRWRERRIMRQRQTNLQRHQGAW